MTILTLTLNPAVDVCATVPCIQPERKLHCSSGETSPGGGGVNVARAIRRLGGDATAVFPYGGTTGELLCDLLQAEDVSVLPVAANGVTREDFAVTELATHRQYRFVLPGPTLTDDELDRCVKALLGQSSLGSIVVLSGSLPHGVAPQAFAEIATAAGQRGAQVVVDTSGPAVGAAARSGVFVLKPSVNELAGHAARPLTTEHEIATAARDLLDSGPNHAILVSLAAAGALLVTTDEPVVTIEPPAVRAASAIGAGDSLVAGLVLALEDGHTLLEAARRGVAAGTAATTAPGHTLCHPDAVARILPDVRVRPIADLPRCRANLRP